MKRLRKYVLGLMLATSVNFSCGQKEESQTSKSKPQPLVEKVVKRKFDNEKDKKLLEKELSKYEPWLLEFIDTNYDDGVKNGIQIMFSEMDSLQFYQRFGFEAVEANAVYVPPPDNLLIFFNNPKYFFNHEFAHAFAAIMNERNVNFGPSRKLIIDIVDARLKKHKNEVVLPYFENSFKIQLEWAYAIYDIRNSILQASTNLNVLIEKKDKKLVNEWRDLIQKLKVLLEKYKKIEQISIQNETERMKLAGWDKGCPDQQKRIDDHNLEISLKLSTPEKERLLLVEKMKRMDNEVNNSYPNDYKKAKILNIDKVRLKFKVMHDSILMSYLLRQEIFARIFESLMTVYIGPDCMDIFKLTDKEIQMFEQMTYIGKPMFADAVSKYRLALRMEADGVDPEKIRADLEYATEYEYKGEKFSWQPTSIKIIGQIPVISAE